MSRFVQDDYDYLTGKLADAWDRPAVSTPCLAWEKFRFALSLCVASSRLYPTSVTVRP